MTKVNQLEVRMQGHQPPESTENLIPGRRQEGSSLHQDPAPDPSPAEASRGPLGAKSVFSSHVSAAGRGQVSALL